MGADCPDAGVYIGFTNIDPKRISEAEEVIKTLLPDPRSNSHRPSVQGGWNGFTRLFSFEKLGESTRRGGCTTSFLCSLCLTRVVGSIGGCNVHDILALCR